MLKPALPATDLMVLPMKSDWLPVDPELLLEAPYESPLAVDDP